MDLKVIATRTPGFSGADLANLVNEAALLAARRNHSNVEQEDFSEALERVVAGLEKKEPGPQRQRKENRGLPRGGTCPGGSYHAGYRPGGKNFHCPPRHGGPGLHPAATHRRSLPAG